MYSREGQNVHSPAAAEAALGAEGATGVEGAEALLPEPAAAMI